MTVFNLFGSNKEYLAGKKAFIFDMDGTLVDSMKYWTLTADDDLSKYPSTTEYIRTKYNDSVMPKYGALELLKFLRLHKIPVCIATDTPKQLAEGMLVRFELESLLDFYISSEDVGTYKNHSTAIYHAAAQRYGLAPEECIVVEDRLEFCKSAKADGFCVIGVFDETSKSESEEMKAICDDFLYDFSEILLSIRSD